MIIVMGREQRVLVGLTDRLRSRDLSVRALADGEDLSDVVFQHDARAVVVVEALPGLAPMAHRGAPLDWDALLRAARGPKRPRIVRCASRPDDGPGTRLRKSGVPFVTVCTGTLVEAEELGLSDARGRTVHVAKDLPVPDGGITPLPVLIDVLAGATTTDELGRSFDVRCSGDGAWAELVGAFGARPKLTARPMARVMSWVGGRALLEVGAPSAPASQSRAAPGWPREAARR